MSDANFETCVRSDEEEASVSALYDSVIKGALSNINEDEELKFRFKLPEDGLALRSVTIIDGVPELLFEAVPKVPTITEEDVATAFRLASEDKRPGFFYTNLPITNPLHQSRLYMLYDPQWLRWTSIGKLLADVDWLMKCMHVGARSNEDKTVFEAWQKTSQLNLATRLDFPKDGRGPTIMSCESAVVQKDDNEMTFPAEPKMKITDGCSSLYTEYITQNFQSVAYYDEPKFLKMQEVIKLVLAVEWLYKEKGVRVSQDWVMKHTSKPTDGVKTVEATDHANYHHLHKVKQPPYEMIPKPTKFERPSSDVTVKTWEAEMYNSLRVKCNVGRRYGYYDFCDAEAIMFKEDGTPCPPQKCLKLGFEHQSVIDGLLAMPKITGWQYALLTEQTPTSAMTEFREKLLEQLPQSSHQEIANPMPVSVDTEVEDSSSASGVEIKITETFQPCPPLALPHLKQTTIVKATIDNYNMLYSGEDPNEPIRPEIPGVCEAIIPDVKSWEEFISEMTVPMPRTWQAPYVGIGEPSAWGGVTTSDFRVREEPMRKMEYEETRVKDNYRRVGPLLGVRAEHIRAQGMFQPLWHQYIVYFELDPFSLSTTFTYVCYR